MADPDPGFVESGSGSRLFGRFVSGSGSGPKFIMTKVLKEFPLKICNKNFLYLLEHVERMPQKTLFGVDPDP